VPGFTDFENVITTCPFVPIPVAPFTGVTDTTVTIGSTDPLTGPAAPGYSEIPAAAQAYFNYINANGGINGRKITLKYLDDAYNPTQTVTLTKQLVLQDKVFAMVGALGTPTHTKVVDFLNSSRVPDLFVASGCSCWDQPKAHPYTFGSSFEPNNTSSPHHYLNRITWLWQVSA